MIDKAVVKDLVNEFIEDNEIFVVDIKVSTSNKITVLVNKPGGITIDECVKLSRHIESNLDREKNDFELSVSSPGLGKPFQVREQYDMSLGKLLEVTDYDGKKTKGILKEVRDDGFIIESEKKTKVKKKESVEFSFGFNDIKSVKTVIKFK